MFAIIIKLLFASSKIMSVVRGGRNKPSHCPLTDCFILPLKLQLYAYRRRTFMLTSDTFSSILNKALYLNNKYLSGQRRRFDLHGYFFVVVIFYFISNYIFIGLISCSCHKIILLCKWTVKFISH